MSIWGPILRAVLKHRESANRPKIDQFENFSSISCTKSKLKGGQFNEKNANSCILGPILWAVVDRLGGLPIGPELSNFEIYELLPTQIPNSKGVSFIKKLPIHVFKAPFWGPF